MNKIRYTRLVLEIWAFTVYFSGKRRSLLHPNKAQRSFFPFYNLILKKFLEKMPERPSQILNGIWSPPPPPPPSPQGNP